MLTRRDLATSLLTAATIGTSFAASAEEFIALPPPRISAGMTLMQALANRRSIREFAPRAISIELVSGLLWAAYGVNRPTGERTAPTWRHALEAEIYVAAENGIWLYDAPAHRLVQTSTADIRAETGTQAFVAGAPLNLIYVADGERMFGASTEDMRLNAFADAGFIGQNVYLYCASEGLATVFRGSVDRARVAHLLNLPATKFVTFAQTVGHPV